MKQQLNTCIVARQIVEATLLNHPLIDDCVVLVRKEDPRQELVAYVVSAGLSREQLESYLLGLLPTDIVPVVYISVSTLPLNDLGQVDEQALIDLEAIDSDLIQRWEQSLESVPEVEHVAVIVEEYKEKIPPLHLSDLLGDQSRGAIESIHREKSGKLPVVSSDAVAVQQESISNGAVLQLEAGDPTTLSSALLRTALEISDKEIIYLKADGSEIVQSYEALLNEAQRIKAGLCQLGLKPQDKVIFQINRNSDFIPAFWGCILGGFVPVPISTPTTYEVNSAVQKKLHDAWQMLDKPLILTTTELSLGLRSLSDLLSLEFKIETVERSRLCEPDKNCHVSQPDDLAVFILTSGSTGVPKGVMLTHQNIISSVIGTSKVSDLTSLDISLNWLPLDHPGPLIRCVIRCVFLGCQQIHADTGIVLQDILKWLDLCDRFQVTTTWAPNFAFALLCERATDIENGHWDLSKIRSILNTAEPIVQETAQKVLKLLSPHGIATEAMHSSWGMAETSSGVTFSDQYLLQDRDIPESRSFTELGFPIPGISLRIVNDNNQVVNEQTIGYLQVKGSTVTKGYYQNPELNREVFTDDGWFNTGDLGFLHNGCLTITGRTKNIIIINGVNYYSHEIEQVVEAVEGVSRSYTAACATRRPGSNTDELIVFFHTAIYEDDRLVGVLKDIRKNLVSKLGIKANYLVKVEKEAIPKTSIGKIQHAQLKKSFEAGEFDAIVKQIDILLSNNNTLPDWFYRQIWRPKEAAPLNTKPTTGLTLVFLDSLGLGELLCAKLDKLKVPYIGVEAGSDFAKLADNRCRIAPQNLDHYRQLLSSVSKELLPITQILHLWTYDKYAGEISGLEALEETQARGVYSLLFLVQALDRFQGSNTPVRLQVIASFSQATSTEEKIACERSPILGVVKTIPQELTWLDCRHLDLPVQENEVNGAYILRELQVIQKEQEVAYRNGQRLVSRIKKVDFTKQEKRDIPFVEGGMYLVTGGLGGIGSEIVKYILKHYKAKLLLVGRTPLPSRNTWNDLQAGDTVKERIETYLSLEQLPGAITYEAVDICNLTQLQQVVERVCNSWQCELNGIIHLAGTIETRLLLEETAESFAATLRPKVAGTLILHKLIENQKNSVFISFSSVNGYFGRMTAGAYAAANRFLDSFSQYQRNLGSLHYCFAWSMWDETGLSRNYQMKDLNRKRGYSIISKEQGLHSFLAGLHREPGYLLVGLDGSKQYIQSYREMEVHSQEKLCAYFTAKNAVPEERLQLEVRDRFGMTIKSEFRQLEEMPLSPTGEIDRKQLAKKLVTSTEYLAPRNEIEEKLINIWQQVLNVPQVGIQDNFFELGGTSLLAVRLFSNINQTFGQKLPLSSLFSSGTVEALAQTISDTELDVKNRISSILTNSKSNWSSLVEIQPLGSKQPLFCVHPLGGEALCYRDLALRLGLEQPVYGLQPIGLDGKEHPLTRIEDMASHYIQEIKTIQPNGPYFLLGCSFGGFVVYEMAQQLHSQGEKVGLLGLIDTVRPGYNKRPPLLIRVFLHLNYISQKGPAYLWQKIIGWSKQGKYEIEQKYKRYLNAMQHVLDITPHLAADDEHLKVIDANVLALDKYICQAYPDEMILLRTSDEHRSDAIAEEYDPQFGWGELVDNLNIHSIPGSHLEMMSEPHVQVVAEQLKVYLK
ncbi:AMP-dependent synthetase and ligase [Calothrix sp. NIES-4071]|nr:AMP-dependent synthetase and ligase [Calothrix sp. NIES-4071]BAZ56142.1 AMP-dependent synthetase and ligase [Calothrix sp. NIES-4105]